MFLIFSVSQSPHLYKEHLPRGVILWGAHELTVQKALRTVPATLDLSPCVLLLLLSSLPSHERIA